MGRPITFDEEAALNKAMHLFWEKGYDATHISDLLEVMHVSRSTLYASFGDKDQLFKLVLAHYKKRSIEKRRVLAEATDSKQALQTFFDHHIDKCYSENVPKSCLITNSSILIGHIDPSIEAILREDFNALERLFCDVLTRGQQRGDISKQTDVHLAAYSLLSLNHSINIMATYQKEKFLATALAHQMIAAL